MVWHTENTLNFLAFDFHSDSSAYENSCQRQPLLVVSGEWFQKSLSKSSLAFSTKLFGKSLKCITLLFNPDSLKNISKEFTY